MAEWARLAGLALVVGSLFLLVVTLGTVAFRVGRVLMGLSAHHRHHKHNHRAVARARLQIRDITAAANPDSLEVRQGDSR